MLILDPEAMPSKSLPGIGQRSVYETATAIAR